MKDFYGTELIENKSVVWIKQRPTGLYLVVGFSGEAVKLARVKKQPGYPDAGARSRYLVEVKTTEMKVMASRDGVFATPSVAETVYSIDLLEKKDFFGKSKNILAEFRSLESQYSPENLTSDGEASRGEVLKRKSELDRKWSLLESYLGLKVEKNY